MPKHSITLTHLRQQQAYSCIPACVRMVLQHYGDARTEGEVIALLGCTPFGTRAADIVSVGQWGYDVHVGYSTLEELRKHVDSGIPVVACLRTGPLGYWHVDAPHAVVVVGYDRQAFYLNDPFLDAAPQKADRMSFRRAWWKTKNRMALIRPRPATPSP